MNDPATQRGPISWMARNAVAANLLMVFFLVGGAATFRAITKEFFPNILVNVRIAHPDIAQLITILR